MDEFYFEEGYLVSNYFVYTANAEALLTNYIDSGYIDLDYYIGNGATALLVADLTEVTGVTKEATADLSSQCSLSATVIRNRFVDSAMSAVVTFTVAAGKIQQAAAAMSSAFTVVAQVQRTRDII